jgi:hypothetical protein
MGHLNAANEAEGYGRGFRPDTMAPHVAKMASPLPGPIDADGARVTRNLPAAPNNPRRRPSIALLLRHARTPGYRLGRQRAREATPPRLPAKLHCTGPLQAPGAIRTAQPDRLWQPSAR